MLVVSLGKLSYFRCAGGFQDAKFDNIDMGSSDSPLGCVGCIGSCLTQCVLVVLLVSARSLMVGLQTGRPNGRVRCVGVLPKYTPRIWHLYWSRTVPVCLPRT